MTDKPSTESVLGIRLSGAFSVLLSLALGALSVTMNPGAHGIENPKEGLWLAGFLLLLGIGTILLSRWAVLVLSLTSGCAGVWLGIGSIISVPFPWLLINIACGAALLTPVICAIRSWRYLR
jgi:hypothetical protein